MSFLPVSLRCKIVVRGTLGRALSKHPIDDRLDQKD
jgi:hypothetical protein